MKVKTVYDLYTYLGKYLDEDLNVRLSFQIGRFMGKAEPVCVDYLGKRNNLFQKYASSVSQKENGEEEYTIPKENLTDFAKELNDLNDVELDDITLELHYSDLESLQLKPRDFAILAQYIIYE